MDSSSLSQPNFDLSKLSDYDKRDLQQQIGNEMQKAKIQECWFPSLHFSQQPLSFLSSIVTYYPTKQTSRRE